MGWRAAALAVGLGLSTPAAALETDRFSLGLPAEVDLVGLAFGVHPELLFRPIQPDGALHLRFAPGLMVGPELAFVPIALGVREVMFPRKRVRPFLGTGLQLQNFVPYGHPVLTRLDMALELGVDVRVADQWGVGLQLSPEIGLVGGFGFGMAVRLGAQLDF
ncbi:MAG: hypothetical protein EP330_26375 [Deltaproteobacteria bacterium]|nr:MAG: hypothetical protein EP330_26375 [Deltaproteobacteria bacterium]